MRVLYAEAVYGEDEISAALNVLKNQPHSLMTSENVLKLESKVSDLFGHTYGIMVNSGSSANLLALQSLELPEKSEVITPALTFATTLAPIVQSNLVPVFIDCKKNTFNIDTELIEAQITPRTRALMIPNLIGNVANLPEIKKIAEKNNLIVIEDSADTIGHTINNEKTRNFSDISTTSFVIFDRDGTLIEPVPYLKDSSKVRLLKNTISGLHLLKKLGFYFGIVTNQSVIGRGFATVEEVNLVNKTMLDILKNEKIYFDFISICPHTPTDLCECRKPKSELGLSAIKNYKIDASKSFMIGDAASDIQFGHMIGFKSIQIGKSIVTNADFVASDILDAANWIQSDLKGN